MKRKQMAFDINPALHTEVKTYAAKRNISMNLWIQRAILEALKKEHSFDKK